MLANGGASLLGQVAGNVVTRKPWYDISAGAVLGASLGGGALGGVIGSAEGGVCGQLAKGVGEGVAGGLSEGAGNSFSPAPNFSPATPDPNQSTSGGP